MSRFSALVLVIGCGVSLAAPVVPEVKQSSKKFFGKDLPGDKRPVADEHYYFDHPYPAVQDTGDFDKDFIKDENSDGGKWQAQMEYDLLRNKLHVAEKDLARLQKKMDSQDEVVQKAKKAYLEATNQVSKDQSTTGIAQHDLAEADGGVDKIESQVADAEDKVAKEVKDLEACKKALEDAKQALKDLKDKKVAAGEKYEKDVEDWKAAEEKRVKDDEEEEKKEEEEKVEEEKRVKQKKEDDKKKKEEDERKQVEEDKATEENVRKEAQTKKEKENEEKEQKKKEEEEEDKKEEEKVEAENKVKRDVVGEKNAKIAARNAEIAVKNAGVNKDVDQLKKDMAKHEAAYKKLVEDETAAYKKASTNYDDIVSDLHNAEAELEKAAATLKTFRRFPHVDQNGGVYDVQAPRSGAAALSGWFAVVLAAAVSMW